MSDRFYRELPRQRFFTGKDALERIFRVKWFFLGFSSGRDPARDETQGQHITAADNADSVMEYLAKLYDGGWRTFAPGRNVEVDGRGHKTTIERSDGGRFLISFAEFEKIADGCRMDSKADDLRLANSTIKLIAADIEREAAMILDEETPF